MDVRTEQVLCPELCLLPSLALKGLVLEISSGHFFRSVVMSFSSGPNPFPEVPYLYFDSLTEPELCMYMVICTFKYDVCSNNCRYGFRIYLKPFVLFLSYKKLHSNVFPLLPSYDPLCNYIIYYSLLDSSYSSGDLYDFFVNCFKL